MKKPILWPKTLLLWLPALLPAYVWRLSIGPLPTTVLELVFGLVVVSITATQGLAPWRDGWKKAEAWRPALLAWTAATVLAILIAPDHVAAFGLWRAYVLEPILYFVLALGMLTTEDKKMLTRSLIIGSIAVALWAVVQYLTGRGIPHPWDTSFLMRRATGPFPFPNAVALFCAPIAALCLGVLLWRSDLLTRRDAWGGFFASSLAVVLAHSVGGTIAILVSALCGLLFNKKTRKYGLAIIIAVPIAYTLAPSRVTAPIVKNLTFQDWSGYVRLRMWKDTMSMLKDRPFFGAGFGAYPTVFKKYQTTTGIEVFQYPHDILLNLWSETGLLGVLAFALIVATWIKLGRREPWLLLPLIAILVHGLVDVPYFKNDLAFAFWTLALLLPHNKKTS